MSQQNDVPPQSFDGTSTSGQPGPVGATPPTSAGSAPPKSAGAGKKIGGIIGIVVVVLIGLGWFGLKTLLNQDKTADAKAGDCIASLEAPKEGETTDASGAGKVDCASAEAQYTVVGRVEDKSEAEFNADPAGELKICMDAGHTTSEYMVWSGVPGGKGYILCLTEKK